MDNLIKLLLLPSIIGLSGGLIVSQSPDLNSDIRSSIQALYDYREQTLNEQPAIKAMAVPTRKPTPTAIPTLTPTAVPVLPTTQQQQPTESEWGVAKQVGEHTYTIQVGSDEQMATPQEVLQAINAYRATNGVSSLGWDDKLGSYAQVRADYFKSSGTIDGHAGFNNYLENENGFDQLGFRRLGENSYYGDSLTGTHLIEWVFAKSPGHDANQLDPGWSHAGVGVTDTAVNIVFGGERM